MFKWISRKNKKNININNLDKIKLKNEEIIFHAGTKFMNGKLVSDGGCFKYNLNWIKFFKHKEKNNFNIKKQMEKWILS